MYWIIQIIRDTWLLLSEVLIAIRTWKTIEEGYSLLRDLDIREVMFDDQFIGLGRTVFTGGIFDSRRTLHWDWYGALEALLSPLCKTIFSL